MTRYISNFHCAVCDSQLTFDSDSETLTCNCGRTSCRYINLREYTRLPEDPLQQRFV